MRTLHLASALAIASVIASSVASCGKEECAALYEKYKECNAEDKDMPGEGMFVAACKEMRKEDDLKDELEASLECAKADSCAKFKTCEEGKQGKKRAKRITKSIAAGKWKDAFDDCTLTEKYYSDDTYKAECAKVFANADKLSAEDAKGMKYTCTGSRAKEFAKVAPELEVACKKMATGQLEKAMAAARALRDSGKEEYKVCSDLKSVAEMAGGNASAAAKQLCEEVDVGEEIQKALVAARANVAAKKTDVPFECKWASDKLEKIGSEWSKTKLDEVTKACYVDLGLVVIEVKGKDAKYGCPYEIKRLQEAVAKYGLVEKHPELAEAFKKLPPKCAKVAAEK